MFRLDLLELVGDVPGLAAEELQRLPGPLNVSFRHEEDDDDGDDGGDDGDASTLRPVTRRDRPAGARRAETRENLIARPPRSR